MSPTANRPPNEPSDIADGRLDVCARRALEGVAPPAGLAARLHALAGEPATGDTRPRPLPTQPVRWRLCLAMAASLAMIFALAGVLLLGTAKPATPSAETFYAIAEAHFRSHPILKIPATDADSVATHLASAQAPLPTDWVKRFANAPNACESFRWNNCMIRVVAWEAERRRVLYVIPCDRLAPETLPKREIERPLNGLQAQTWQQSGHLFLLLESPGQRV